MFDCVHCVRIESVKHGSLQFELGADQYLSSLVRRTSAKRGLVVNESSRRPLCSSLYLSTEKEDRLVYRTIAHYAALFGYEPDSRSSCYCSIADSACSPAHYLTPASWIPATASSSVFSCFFSAASGPNGFSTYNGTYAAQKNRALAGISLLKTEGSPPSIPGGEVRGSKFVDDTLEENLFPVSIEAACLRRFGQPACLPVVSPATKAVHPIGPPTVDGEGRRRALEWRRRVPVRLP